LRDRRRLRNDLEGIARVCRARGKGLIVDAMSSFAALPIDVAHDAVRRADRRQRQVPRGRAGHGLRDRPPRPLLASAGNSHSLAMDLHDQYTYMQRTTQWRFTPPTHVVAALRAAIDQFVAEGGQAARGARYAANCATLIEGMRALGFRPYLEPAVQAPIIVTFHAPSDPATNSRLLRPRCAARGYILYPGKLTQVETFRVGCIGAIDANEMRNVVSAIGATLHDMGP
jgi:2-aminoethylphosphonate-pyruvate transaminase